MTEPQVTEQTTEPTEQEPTIKPDQDSQEEAPRLRMINLMTGEDLGNVTIGQMFAMLLGQPDGDKQDDKQDDEQDTSEILTLEDLLMVHALVKNLLTVILPRAKKTALLHYHNNFFKPQNDPDGPLSLVQAAEELFGDLHLKLHKLMKMTDTGLAPIPF